MKVSELIAKLSQYREIHGDDEIEFINGGADLGFVKIHDGYNLPTDRVCEIRLEVDNRNIQTRNE